MTEEQQTDNAQQGSDELPVPALRTFRSDVERYIKEKGMTLAEITASEITSGHLRHAENGHANLRSAKRIILFSVAALMLLLGSTAGVVFLFRGSARAPVPAIRPEATSLIMPEETFPLEAPEGERAVILSNFQEKIKQPLPENRLVFFPIFEQSADGAERLVSTERFFDILDISPPSDLTRALGSSFQWSVLPSQGINHLLLVFTATQPSRAFAGMLQWELALIHDLRPLYSSRVNTDTGNNVFTDMTMNNNDVRALYNSKGMPVLLYAFFNKNTLLIASSAETLERAIGRIAGVVPI